MRFILLALFFAGLVFHAFAGPGKLEVWFLSPPHLGSLIRKWHPPLSKFLAQNFRPKNCVPMGDGCFHPQHGYMENEVKIKETQKNNSKGTQKSNAHHTFNSIEDGKINCEKGHLFDLYCGQAESKPSRQAKVEVWVDTSSSFRTIDYSKDPNHCERRRFVSRLKMKCGGKLGVMTFDSSLRAMGGLGSLCVSYGMNDLDRLMKWIKNSDAEHLIVLTDTSEMTSKFNEFLDSMGAVQKGVDAKGLEAKGLIDLADHVAKMCQ